MACPGQGILHHEALNVRGSGLRSLRPTRPLSQFEALDALLYSRGRRSTVVGVTEGCGMLEAAMALAGTLGLIAGRLVYRLLSDRTRVRLARLRQEGTSDRVRSLPPGSVLVERRAGEEVRVVIGGGERG